MRTQNTETRPRGRHESATVTRAEYNALLARMEDIEDSLDLLRAQEDGQSDDAWSEKLVERMLAGEHPLRLWREHRSMTLDALSRATGVAAGYLSEIESGKKPGSAVSLKKCAAALNVHMEDLVNAKR